MSFPTAPREPQDLPPGMPAAAPSTAPGARDDRRAAERGNAQPRRAIERSVGGPAGALPRPQVIATLAGVLLSLLLAGLDQTDRLDRRSRPSSATWRCAGALPVAHDGVPRRRRR
jgi:hypothetical protein